MADPERALLSDIDRVIDKKLAVKFERNEILGLDDFNVFTCYRDLWKTEAEKWNAVRQGIINSSSCILGCMKLQINALNKDASNVRDVAIANAYVNKFIIPLDFEMLDSMMYDALLPVRAQEQTML